MRKNNLDGMFGSNRTISQNQMVAVQNAFKLNQNYPKPFNGSTTISFEIPDQRLVQPTLNTKTDQVVYELFNQGLSVSRHYFQWNGTDGSGLPVNRGLYLCRLKSGDFSQNITMRLLKYRVLKIMKLIGILT